MYFFRINVHIYILNTFPTVLIVLKHHSSSNFFNKKNRFRPNVEFEKNKTLKLFRYLVMNF